MAPRAAEGVDGAAAYPLIAFDTAGSRFGQPRTFQRRLGRCGETRAPGRDRVRVDGWHEPVGPEAAFNNRVLHPIDHAEGRRLMQGLVWMLDLLREAPSSLRSRLFFTEVIAGALTYPLVPGRLADLCPRPPFRAGRHEKLRAIHLDFAEPALTPCSLQGDRPCPSAATWRAARRHADGDAAGRSGPTPKRCRRMHPAPHTGTLQRALHVGHEGVGSAKKCARRQRPTSRRFPSSSAPPSRPSRAE